MFLAKTSDGRRVSATREEKGYCPKCNDHLTPKMGEIYEWHWAHKPGCRCDFRKSSTPWHYTWYRRYYSMDGWELETSVDEYEFDGINLQKSLSLFLTKKLDKSEIDSFVSASKKLNLKPIVIINQIAFKNFTLAGELLTPKRRHDPSWQIFWDHAQQNSPDRSATLWLDIEEEKEFNQGLHSGMYNLYFNNENYGKISINKNRKQKTQLQKKEPETDKPTSERNI